MAAPDYAFLDPQQTALDNAARRRSDVRDAAGLGSRTSRQIPWSIGDVNDRCGRDAAERRATEVRWDYPHTRTFPGPGLVSRFKIRRSLDRRAARAKPQSSKMRSSKSLAEPAEDAVLTLRDPGATRCAGASYPTQRWRRKGAAPSAP